MPARAYAPAFEAFVAPARRTSQLWLTILGLVLAVLIYTFLIVIMFLILWVVLGADPDPEMLWLLEMIEAKRPMDMIVLLLTFFGMAGGIMAVVAMLHERPVWTLFGPGSVVMQDFVVAALVTSAVMGTLMTLWFQFNEPIPNIDLYTWVSLLPFVLVLIAVQTGAEELVFRGYLQQQLAARFASPVVWLILPSLLFGFAHFDITKAGSNVWFIVAATGVFGLLAADLTARTGSIGAAWGFHFANNCFAILLIVTDGTLTGLGLYKTPYDISDAEVVRATLPFGVLMMIAIWFILRRLLSR
ncbi:MAG: CPBP family intramembrane glutamic endopeptidase [Pseudomonadota bacterium]